MVVVKIKLVELTRALVQKEWTRLVQEGISKTKLNSMLNRSTS